MANEENNIIQIEPKYFTGTCRKGEIWFIKGGNSKSTGTEIWSDRPAIIVSNEGFNSKAGFVNVVYLTTSSKPDRPYHVPVISSGKQATALCEQTPPVDKSRLSFYMGSVTDEEMVNIDKAILFVYNISNSLRPNSLFQKWLNAIERYNVDLTADTVENEFKQTNQTPCKTDMKLPIDIENIDIHDLIRQRDQYKMLYERERQTVENLMALQ